MSCPLGGVGTSMLLVCGLCARTNEMMRPPPSLAAFFPPNTLTTDSARIVHMDLGGDKETVVQSLLGRGQFTRRKWYCE
jgi:hypothetical protein